VARTREYDQSQLLDRAMTLFWQHGFAETSMDQLVHATGVSRSSLYTAYPDKRTLFLAALQHYLDTVTTASLQQLQQHERASASVRRFMLHLVPQRDRHGAPNLGCLLTNTAVEMGNSEPQVAARVRKAFARVENALASRLATAQAQGDLGPEYDPALLAKQLLVLIQGIRVMSRLRVDKRLLRDAINSALAPLS
jgi:TetR/AcrR family transcriptional repressor of nem operon